MFKKIRTVLLAFLIAYAPCVVVMSSEYNITGENPSTSSRDFPKLPKTIDEINQCLLLNKLTPGTPLDTFATKDPLEAFNRMMFAANQKILIAMVRKAGAVYEILVPDFWRERISDAANNISMPARFLNNLMQGKFLNAAKEVGRFLINVSLGIGGLFDSSTFFGFEAPPREDLGQTLGYWGVGPGAYLVIPFVGNTNVRDFLGFIGEMAMDPLFHLRTVIPGLRVFVTYNELMTGDKGKRYLRMSEIVPDPYYEQKTLHDILRVALSCQ